MTRNKVIAAWESTVASAAPLTPQCRHATSTTSSAIFTREEISTAIKGVRLSPNPRSAAEKTLYTARKGIPAKTIRRYASARGSASEGVWSRRSAQGDKSAPAAAKKRKRTAKSKEKVARICGMADLSPLPYFWAQRIESPRVKPVMMVRNRFTTVPVAPTAANAGSPSTRPTIKASAQL